MKSTLEENTGFSDLHFLYIVTDFNYQPQKIQEIKDHIDQQLEQSPNYFSWDRYGVENTVFDVLSNLGYGEKEIPFQRINEENALFDAYSIYRSFNQLNKACNKFWAVVELANVISPKIWNKSYTPLGKKFSPEFSGSLVSTLYYSQISALISILSIFGCVSIYDEKAGVPYNLIRVKNGRFIVKRSEYLKKVFNVEVKSWHSQIISLARGLSEKLSEFPKIEIRKTEELRKLRDTTHYGILSKVGARDVKQREKLFPSQVLV